MAVVDDVPELSVPERAHELVSEILGDLEKSMRRAANLFKSGEEVYNSLFNPMALMAIDHAGLEPPKIMDRREDVRSYMLYQGEHRDLLVLTQSDNWVIAIQKIHRRGPYNPFMVKVGDYINIPVTVPEYEINGMQFEKLDIMAEAVVADVIDGKVIFQFEKALFSSAINKSETTAGGFPASNLSIYLNEVFITIFNRVKEYMMLNNYGKLITLPTKYEVFGAGKVGDVNWTKEPVQLEYFKDVKNRIRVKDNDTVWWWLSSVFAGSAAAFCNSDSGGAASHYSASSVGGCAPAFCVV
jgi:hypothetical protein